MSEKQKKQTLKELRVQARLTQPDVEEITAKKDRRIPQATLSDWENGKKKPDVENILTLSALYKVSVEKIVDAYLYTKERNKK
jgi:transcriptional regulator with XRE-family HTH domain